MLKAGRGKKEAGRLLWILLNTDFNFHLRSSNLPESKSLVVGKFIWNIKI